MRYIVYGAGAIGGLAGAGMAEGGEDVLLIARGAHAEAIARHGLSIESAEGSRTVDVPVVTDPADAGIDEGDVVLLAMKSQDTAGALEALRRVAPPDTPVVCVQNGVDNERSALRRRPSAREPDRRAVRGPARLVARQREVTRRTTPSRTA